MELKGRVQNLRENHGFQRFFFRFLDYWGSYEFQVTLGRFYLKNKSFILFKEEGYFIKK